MKASILLYILAFVLIVVLIFVFGQRLISRDAPALIVDTSGNVELQTTGQNSWQPLALGSFAKDGDIIRTPAAAEASLSWMDVTHIWLDPNTEVKLGRNEFNSTSGEKKLDVTLNRGKIWVKAREASTGKLTLIIKTPDAAVAIQGTLVSIEIKPDGATYVELFEGSISLQKGSQPDSLSEKAVWTYKKDTKLDSKQRMTEEQILAWQQNQKISGAFLIINQPKEGEQVTKSIMTMSGYTDAGNEVTVMANGDESKASVDENGSLHDAVCVLLWMYEQLMIHVLV